MLIVLKAAIAFLKSRSRLRSTVVIDSNLPKTVLPNGDLSGRGKPPVQGMREWLQQLGHKVCISLHTIL